MADSYFDQKTSNKTAKPVVKKKDATYEKFYDIVQYDLSIFLL